MDREKIIKEVKNIDDNKKNRISCGIIESTYESSYEEIGSGVINVFRDAKTIESFDIADKMLIALADFSIKREFDTTNPSEIIDKINELSDEDIERIGTSINDGVVYSDREELIKGVIDTFEDCSTEILFQSANMMLIAVCGYSISTLLEMK